ncbi:ABC transporter substrate-binding protein [Kineosporia sp. NBRC 101731]|uniref:ABC transporter substrate-binding protein n=1 Tax=Kineosporia sp. NBRC 101731 TaxID=3032199 RepID=UPI0024A0EC65|nr:ABC transporter substrate-binding protein [Kineosporia sp. NBRC 101731]GLY27206.1 ABC transporter substrate-binding protein [Kineosporia sp. NBRC 101731]
MAKTVLVRRTIRVTLTATVAVGVLTSAAACGGGGSDAAGSAQVAGVTKVRWIYDWTPTSADLPVLKGLEEGWFRQADLDVVTTPGGEISQLQSVGAGEHDMTVGGGVELLINQAQGLPVQAVGVVQPLALTGLICNPNSNITADDPNTLLGKKLATASTDADDVVWQAWRNHKGLNGKVTEVSQEAGLPLLFQGVVDCYPEFLTRAPLEAEREFGRKPVKIWYSKDENVIGQVIDVNTDFAEKNPAAVKGFVDVYARGMQWAAQNQAEAVELMTKVYPDSDPSVTAQELKTLSGFWSASYQDKHGYLAMDDATWKPTVQMLKRAGQIKELPEMASVYSTKYLPSTPYLP